VGWHHLDEDVSNRLRVRPGVNPLLKVREQGRVEVDNVLGLGCDAVQFGHPGVVGVTPKVLQRLHIHLGPAGGGTRESTGRGGEGREAEGKRRRSCLHHLLQAFDIGFLRMEQLLHNVVPMLLP